MSKLIKKPSRSVRNITGQKFFKPVKDILGKKRAVRELRKVVKSSKFKQALEDFPNKRHMSPKILGSAFVWGETPQGWEFWHRVDTYIDIAKSQRWCKCYG